MLNALQLAISNGASTEVINTILQARDASSSANFQPSSSPKSHQDREHESSSEPESIVNEACQTQISKIDSIDDGRFFFCIFQSYFNTFLSSLESAPDTVPCFSSARLLESSSGNAVFLDRRKNLRRRGPYQLHETHQRSCEESRLRKRLRSILEKLWKQCGTASHLAMSGVSDSIIMFPNNVVNEVTEATTSRVISGLQQMLRLHPANPQHYETTFATATNENIVSIQELILDVWRCSFGEKLRNLAALGVAMFVSARFKKTDLKALATRCSDNNCM